MGSENTRLIILWLHYFVSVSFFIITIWILFRSFRGMVYNRPYLSLDKILAYIFIVNMYLQLLFGLILFSNLGLSSRYDYQGANGTIVMASKRLWPIEHIVLMFFALFIANLGLIISSKSAIAKQKHRMILIYYSISIILIATSLASIYLL